MDISTIFFYVMAATLILCAMTVVITPNPIYSALFLALTMIGLSIVYFVLEAFFIAGVQLIVYAGAVIILFTMVLMIFDLKKEENFFSKKPISILLKMSVVGWLCGLIVGAVALAQKYVILSAAAPTTGADSTKALARLIFTDYLFAFEALGVLLLLIAIGAVSMSRAKGGTHVKS